MSSATTRYIGGGRLLYVGALCVGGLVHVLGRGVGGGALGERSGLVGVAGLVHVG